MKSIKRNTRGAPVIGITLDHEQPGGYSRFPWYALRENYCTAVAETGGAPLALPHEAALAERYLGLIDGLVITGGAFDVPPALYGDSSRHESVTTKDRRTAFEFAVARGALERNMPLLAICGGEQLLNVALGGTLIQHIPAAIPGALEHEQKNPRNEPGHEVYLVENTLLRHIAGTQKASVNTAHHQAVREPAPGVTVNAVAPDGVIEGIEVPAHRFCIGVQWHPEFFIDPLDRKLFEAFIHACANGK